MTEHISDSEIALAGYNIIRRDPKRSKETGLLIYIHHSISFNRVIPSDDQSIESVWLNIKLKRSKPVTLGFVYRNPAEHVNWFDDFTLLMEDVSLNANEIFILGDFNIDLLKPNNFWIRTFQSFHLTQLIDKPTRIGTTSKTLLDHIYTSTKQNVSEICSPVYGCSDHFPVCITWSKKGVKIPRNSHRFIKYRNFSHFVPENFLFDLSNSHLSSVYQFTNPDEALEVFYHNFLNVYDKHAPIKIKRVKATPKLPWLTPQLQEAMDLRDSLLASGLEEEFKKQRNLVNYLKRASKKKYFQDLVSSKSDSKSIWKALNQLTNKKAETKRVSFKDLSPDKLNAHFSNVASSTIISNRSADNKLEHLYDYCLSKKISYAQNIPPMAVHDVYNALLHLKQTNSRGLDDLDGKILKLSAPVISETLTYIFNLCISKNQFPKAFKVAKVIPLFKSGDRSDPANYRPISLLSTLSKPLEKYIKKHIVNHFNHFNLFHPCQSGFRANHSCHTALTTLVDTWLKNINNNEITGVLMVDFAKAFDVIDHSLLLRKLHMYGLSNDTLQFMSSFLCDRNQLVSITDSKSTLLPMKYGVPQGSVLGPLLFSIYINDLPLILSALCQLFADDTTLHTSHSKLEKISFTLQKNVNELINWAELNHMCLHPQKTKCMIITTRQKRQNFSSGLPPLYINGKLIEEVESHKLLGVIIDNNLSWSNHVTMICNNVSKKIYQLSKIKHFLNLHSRKIFFHAYVESYINYASTIWDSASENIMKPLLSLHRRALRLVLNKPFKLTASDYTAVDTLPLKFKLKYNKAVFMFKILSGCAPSILTNNFIVNDHRHTHKLILPLPRVDIFKSSLSYSGGFLWNSISTTLNVHTSLNVFKHTYHKHLMSELSK